MVSLTACAVSLKYTLDFKNLVCKNISLVILESYLCIKIKFEYICLEKLYYTINFTWLFCFLSNYT